MPKVVLQTLSLDKTEKKQLLETVITEKVLAKLEFICTGHVDQDGEVIRGEAENILTSVLMESLP